MNQLPLRAFLCLIAVTALTPLGEAPPPGGLARRSGTTARAVAPPSAAVRAELRAADSLAIESALLVDAERFTEALAVARARVERLEQLPAVDDSLIGAAWSAVGNIHLLLGDAGRAADADSTALFHRLRRFGRRHIDVAESLSQLGRDYKALGEGRRRGVPLHLEALRLREDLLGPDHPDVAATLSDLANIYRLMARHDEATRLLGRALSIRRAACGSESEEVASTLTAMAFIRSRREEWPEAERLFRGAVRIRRTAPGVRRENMAMSLGGLGMALRHLHRPEEAIPFLREVLELRTEVRSEVPPGSGRATFHLATALDLAAAQLETGDSLNAWQTCAWGTGRILLETIGARTGVDAESLATLPLPVIQRLLPPRTALIGWIDFLGWMRGGYPYWAWIVKNSGPPVWIRYDAPRTDTVVYSWAGLDTTVNQLQAAGSWPFRVEDTARMDELLRGVYRRSFAPLEPHLRDVDRLVVVSGDVHHGVPFEALIGGEDRFVNDRFLISYVPSAALYAWQRTRPPPPRAPAAWRALLLSDPGVTGRPVGGLAPLEAARQETDVLAELLPGTDRSELATPVSVERLRRGDDLEAFDLIHLATHAHIDISREELSALYVTSADSGVTEAITAGDIATGWKLDAQLVTLSGCATVLGRGAGIEGLLGLNQAILGAGARTLLASLWPVDDRATALLVSRFYRNLIGTAGHPGMGMTAALQEARRFVREYRDPQGLHPYRHPSYWAGFVLTGAPD